METRHQSLKCVVHYSSEAKYSTIVPLNEKPFDRITKAKELREKWKAENWHAEQCDAVPSELQLSISGFHMTSCCKKFTLFISRSKKKENTGDNETEHRPSRQRNVNDTRSLFPKHCFFCKCVKKRESS